MMPWRSDCSARILPLSRASGLAAARPDALQLLLHDDGDQAGDVGVPDEQPIAFVAGRGCVLAQRYLQEVLPEPPFHRHGGVISVRFVGFLEQQVAGPEGIGVSAEVAFEVLRRGADVFGWGGDDAVQVLADVCRLSGMVIGL